MMLSEQIVDSDSAEEQIRKLGPNLREYLDADAEEANGARCLNALLTYPVEHWKGSKSTIGRLIELARRQDRKDERDALRTYGLSLDEKKGTAIRTRPLLVANHHRGLESIFKGTPWADDAWKDALLEIDGVERSKNSRQFCGTKQRFVIIPAAMLPELAADESDETP